MHGEDDRIPVHLLTGFLGSGKTTLLRHLLADPRLRDTAVVINEFGEVGIDHLLVREVAEDVVLLGSGCVCCTVRDDLVGTLAGLRGLAGAGDIPPFSRVAVETTGLADPAPIAAAVLSESRLLAAYRLGRIVATVEAVNGAATLDAHPVAVNQAALADRIVVTKTDLVAPDACAGLARRIGEINRTADILMSARDRMPSPDLLFAEDAGPPDQALQRDLSRASGGIDHGGITTFTVTFRQPVVWADFVEWLELLLAARGGSILRVKGLLAIAGDDRPVVIQGVQHVVYPPERLAAWPDERATRLVLIARDLTRSAIERSLRETLGIRDFDPGNARARSHEAARRAHGAAQLPLS